MDEVRARLLVREIYILLCDLSWKCVDSDYKEWRGSVTDPAFALSTINPAIRACKEGLQNS